jgi:tetratricopeptide (TPR) repeat protein
MSSFDVTPLAIERRLRAMGVALSGVKKHRDAIEILKLNAQLFPNSPRVYQALGEAYATSGDSKLAIGNYEKSLAIDPNNATSKSAFAKLRGGKAP